MSGSPAGTGMLGTGYENKIGHMASLLVHNEPGAAEFRAWLCQCSRYFMTDEALDEHRSGRDGEAAASDLRDSLAREFEAWAEEIRRKAVSWAYDEMAEQVEELEKTSSIGDFVEKDRLVVWARRQAFEALLDGRS